MDGPEPQESLKSGTECLPDDVMHKIFSRLPLKSVIQFSCVCKSWLRIIRDPTFGKLHHSESESEPAILFLTYDVIGVKKVISISFMKQEGLELIASQTALVSMIGPHSWNLVGTCDGLLCFVTSGREEIIMVCNPITREHVLLPKPSPCRKSHRVMHAFGLDPITVKYKVVRILCRRNIRILAEVCTLGDSIYWREVRGFNHVPRGRSVYAKGAVHWLIDPHPAENLVEPQLPQINVFHLFPHFPFFPGNFPNDHPPEHRSKQERILSFDLGKEEFRLMQHTRIGKGSTLAELDNCLSIIDTSSGFLAEVSVMKDSWRKEYDLPVHYPRLLIPPRLACAHEHNGVLLIWLEDYRLANILVTYDSKEFARKDLKLGKLPTWLNWKTCSCYRGSLVSLRHFKSAAEDYRSDVVRFVGNQQTECHWREQDAAAKCEDRVVSEDRMLH